MLRFVCTSLLCGLAGRHSKRRSTAAPPQDAAGIRDFRRWESTTCQRPYWVYDRDGNTVSGLRPEQFRLFDNKKEQNIQVDVSFTPISLVICLQANSHVQQLLPQLRKIGNLVSRC